MKGKFKNEYVKPAQKDYSMSFKLQVVQEVENGGLGIKAATRKYGIQGNRTDRRTTTSFNVQSGNPNGSVIISTNSRIINAAA
jgi:transposase-like protein